MVKTRTDTPISSVIGVVAVDIFLAAEEVEPAFVTIEKEIARGNLITVADVEAEQQELLQAEQSRVSDAQDALERDIRSLGDATVHRCVNMPCISAHLWTSKCSRSSPSTPGSSRSASSARSSTTR